MENNGTSSLRYNILKASPLIQNFQKFPFVFCNYSDIPLVNIDNGLRYWVNPLAGAVRYWNKRFQFIIFRPLTD
jgi:hypothetical protein